LLPAFELPEPFEELDVLDEPDVLEELPDPDDCVDVEVELPVLWPWNDRAAATDTAPVRTRAPATNQRLIRRISSSPASRALTAFLLTSAMVGAGCKKTLKQV
jgi:hypothetical protein